MGMCDAFFCNAFDVMGVGFVMYAEFNLKADERVSVAPVDDALGYKFFVWDEERFVVTRDDFSVARGHFVDPAEGAVFKLYDVARFDGTVTEEQDA